MFSKSKLSVLPKTLRFSSSLCPSTAPIKPIVTLLDTLSSVGSNLALLLKQNLDIYELRLFDEENNTNAFACDLNEIDTRTKLKSFSCKSLKNAIVGAHVVISTGGCQEKPGSSQRELFDKNLDNVRNVAMFLAEFNPEAIYCIAKPPVEALVPMVSEEYKKAETYDPRKIIGVATVASMIANTFIAEHTNQNPADVLCPIIGGLSPKTTIPVLSQTKPNVPFNPDLYKKLQEAVAHGEETLLCKGAMFCYSKAVAISRFIHLVVKALKGEKHCVESAFVAQTGHIGEFLPYMTSIVKLGPQGVASTHMPKINDLETTRLRAAEPHIVENILLGQTFIHGDFSIPPKFKVKRTCDALLKRKVQECNNRAGMQYIN
ncbi:malate dehydrogenase [Tribolium castaneum]|uniref:Malate dehydrogenase, mitochondrial n=1 Tax=Tribolium castaneum TaxID=7070 RepID=D2A2I7_TRICA|nr:PREDICTED: malate dehydrogenase [Tribolium castaneum]EFA02020.1 putative malate dehydrogenase, mitochondrial-like Protein [Tribolium castaneum]|eukprot:XP_969184.1 PREDICTED: malate dehydrogenase [Tribolium castaneum]